MELENLKRENEELRHELASVYKFHCTFCNFKTVAYISLSSHMSIKHDNILNIDKRNLLVQQSVQTENNVEVEDSVSENEEEFENEKEWSDSKIEEFECDTCDKLFANKAELDKHKTDTGIQCGFCHFCVVHGEELDCPELRKCVEMDHMDFSWHPTFHVLHSNSLV